MRSAPRSISSTDAMCSFLFWMRRFPRRCWVRFNAAESFFTGKKMCRNAFRSNPVAFGSNSPPVRHRIADAVLVAAGRQSNTAEVGLEEAGGKTTEPGTIPVNGDFQTNI